jgi:hypothetical protein
MFLHLHDAALSAVDLQVAIACNLTKEAACPSNGNIIPYNHQPAMVHPSSILMVNTC